MAIIKRSTFSGLPNEASVVAYQPYEDALIRLQIERNKSSDPTPPVPDPAVPDDMVPWRMGKVARERISEQRRRVGHRPKRKGYYYRFLGGNAEFANIDGVKDELAMDGDFEFRPGRGRKTVRIVMDENMPREDDVDYPFDPGWEFHAVFLIGPIHQTNGLPDTPADLGKDWDLNEVLLDLDTNDRGIASGHVGIVVRKKLSPERIKKMAANNPERAKKPWGGWKFLYVDPMWDNR